MYRIWVTVIADYNTLRSSVPLEQNSLMFRLLKRTEGICRYPLASWLSEDTRINDENWNTVTLSTK